MFRQCFDSHIHSFVDSFIHSKWLLLVYIFMCTSCVFPYFFYIPKRCASPNSSIRSQFCTASLSSIDKLMDATEFLY